MIFTTRILKAAAFTCFCAMAGQGEANANSASVGVSITFTSAPNALFRAAPIEAKAVRACNSLKRDIEGKFAKARSGFDIHCTSSKAMPLTVATDWDGRLAVRP